MSTTLSNVTPKFAAVSVEVALGEPFNNNTYEIVYVGTANYDEVGDILRNNSAKFLSLGIVAAVRAGRLYFKEVGDRYWGVMGFKSVTMLCGDDLAVLERLFNTVNSLGFNYHKECVCDDFVKYSPGNVARMHLFPRRPRDAYRWKRRSPLGNLVSKRLPDGISMAVNEIHELK